MKRFVFPFLLACGPAQNSAASDSKTEALDTAGSAAGRVEAAADVVSITDLVATLLSSPAAAQGKPPALLLACADGGALTGTIKDGGFYDLSADNCAQNFITMNAGVLQLQYAQVTGCVDGALVTTGYEVAYAASGITLSGEFSGNLAPHNLSIGVLGFASGGEQLATINGSVSNNGVLYIFDDQKFEFPSTVVFPPLNVACSMGTN